MKKQKKYVPTAAEEQRFERALGMVGSTLFQRCFGAKYDLEQQQSKGGVS